jgi:hypothetical protein
MIIYKLPNANAGVIAVTGTATLLKDLINTAGSTTATFPELNAVDLIVEDGDVRMYADGNTPTASKGELLKQGTTYRLRGADFHNIRLIRTGSSNVAVGVRLGFTEGQDLQDSSAGGGAAGATTLEYNSSAPTLSNGGTDSLQGDVNGNLKVTLATMLAGEDLTNNLQKVEHQYSYSRKTADGQVKGAAGFVHTVTIAPTTATPTAGLLTIYDSLTETGTIIFSEWVFATTPAHTVTIDAAAGTGIYVGYDATLANVSCTVSYR